MIQPYINADYIYTCNNNLIGNKGQANLNWMHWDLPYKDGVLSHTSLSKMSANVDAKNITKIPKIDIPNE